MPSTHYTTTRLTTITNAIISNTREDITAPDCRVWQLVNCDDVTDIIFSRQDWSSYNGQSVNFEFEDDLTLRSVTEATSITAPVDSRDLIGLIKSTSSSCRVIDISVYDTTTSGTNNLRFLSLESGNLASNGQTIDTAFLSVEDNARLTSGGILAFSRTDQYLIWDTVLDEEIANVTLGSGETIESVAGGTELNWSGVRPFSDGSYIVPIKRTAESDIIVRKYGRNGSVSWSKSYAGAFDIRTSPMSSGLVAIRVDYGTGDPGVAYVYNAASGTLAGSFTFSDDDTFTPRPGAICVSVESGGAYVYLGTRQTSDNWKGGSSSEYSVVKYSLDGTFQWGKSLDTISPSGTSLFQMILHNSQLYLAKNESKTHEGQTTPASIVRYSSNGVLTGEWSLDDVSTAGRMDIDSELGYVAVADSLDSGTVRVFDPSDGSAVWGTNDASTFWTFGDGFSFDGVARFLSFKNSTR